MQALRLLTNLGSFRKKILTKMPASKKQLHNLLVLVIRQSFYL